jgi:hypothetical protein
MITGWIAEPLPVAANKPRGRYDEILGVLRGSERPHHPARMPILENSPLNPFSFNEITFAITEFEDLDFPLAVLAIKFECDPVFEPIEIWRAAQRTYSLAFAAGCLDPAAAPIRRALATLEPPTSS